MLAAAHTTAPLARADGAVLPFPDACFDGVVCGFALRNFVDARASCSTSARVCCKEGGRFAAVDATVPTNPVIRAGNAVWFRGAVPLLGRLLAHDEDAYRYLPKSTAYLPAHDALARQLAHADFYDTPRRHVHGRVRAPAHGDARMTTTPARAACTP